MFKGLSLVTTVKDVLMGMRTNIEESFAKVFEDAEKLASDMNIEVTKPRTPKRSVYRACAAANSDDSVSVSEYYRINMFIPLLDGLCSYLDYRFGKLQQTALSLMGLIPACITDSVESLQPAIDMYSELLSSQYEVRGEFTIWRHIWTSSEKASQAAQVNTALGALQECKGETLPNIKALLQILATLPVTTAEPERIFSKVERTATAIRSMDEERLEGLVLLQAHLDNTPSINSVLDEFAKNGARRIKLLL